MAKPTHELIATSLKRAKAKSRKGIIRSADIRRVDLDRLIKGKWLHPVMKGWYLLSKPSAAGESSAWYASYWDFLSVYLEERFGENYCLVPVSSIDLHLGASVIPNQLIDRKSTRLNSSHSRASRMPSSA